MNFNKAKLRSQAFVRATEERRTSWPPLRNGSNLTKYSVVCDPCIPLFSLIFESINRNFFLTLLLRFLLALSVEFAIFAFKLYYNPKKKGNNGITNIFKGR